jgi:hypothetical protein
MHISIGRVIILVVLLSAILVALFGGALWAGRRWVKRHPSAKGARQAITPTGFVLYGCQTLALFVGVAARELQPSGALGEFLGTPGGVVAYLVCLIVGFSIAAHALGKLGHPVAREREHRTDEPKH